MNHPTIKFRPALVNQIRRGRKTQARRPVRYSPHSTGRTLRRCPFRKDDIIQLVEEDEQRTPWDDLTAAQRIQFRKQGYGAGAIINLPVQRPCEADFIRVASTPGLQALVDASDEDITAEGFQSRDEFLDHYEATFERPVDTIGTVWVIDFRYTSDVPYFLAEQAGHMHPEQYVHSTGGALRDEREAVGPETLSEYAKQNRDKDRVRKLEAMAGRLAGKRSLDDRLRELRQMGAPTRDVERLIQRKLKELEDKLRRAA